MGEVVAAYAAYKQADADALLARWRARATLGRAVENEHSKGSTLKSIAARLGVVDEQVFRYRRAYRDWKKDRPNDPLD